MLMVLDIQFTFYAFLSVRGHFVALHIFDILKKTIGEASR